MENWPEFAHLKKTTRIWILSKSCFSSNAAKSLKSCRSRNSWSQTFIQSCEVISVSVALRHKNADYETKSSLSEFSLLSLLQNGLNSSIDYMVTEVRVSLVRVIVERPKAVALVDSNAEKIWLCKYLWSKVKFKNPLQPFAVHVNLWQSYDCKLSIYIKLKN